MAKKIRLFWAVNLPGELKVRLAEARRDLFVPGSDAKWVETENLHLTVVFLGDTDINCINEMVAAVDNSLQGIRAFSLNLGGLGFFPATGRPKVLWMGVGGDVKGFKELHRVVQNALAPLGFTPEARSFSPHLTLARIKSPRGCDTLVKRVNSLSQIKIPGVLKVDSVDLMHSELSPKGPVYSVLASVGFKPAGL